MFIPLIDKIAEVTPTDFERISLELLKNQISGLEDVDFKHNQIFKMEDGNYQIDGVITFEVMGVKYITLVECKKYKYPISRDKVQLLYDKIRTVGANKGIIISTSNFQSGSIEYAKKHGIALIQIANNEVKHETRSLQMNVILNSLREFKNSGQYLFVMQEKGDAGVIICKYLDKENTYLKEFLLNEKTTI